ncbi:MAG TPA: hypothetical protein VKM55_04235 [Candidatus Lokiarchaeia archaeon]|nr:hypothetical protein [Candidatus Lokiarchaeia archaeon]
MHKEHPMIPISLAARPMPAHGFHARGTAGSISYRNKGTFTSKAIAGL